MAVFSSCPNLATAQPSGGMLSHSESCLWRTIWQCSPRGKIWLLSFYEWVCRLKAIAERMGIQLQSLHKYLYRIRKKLNVHTSQEILAALGSGGNMLKFTKRGSEVFQLYLKGYSGRKIGTILGMSYSGVRRHKEKMVSANSCASMRELAARFYDGAESSGSRHES